MIKLMSGLYLDDVGVPAYTKDGRGWHLSVHHDWEDLLSIYEEDMWYVGYQHKEFFKSFELPLEYMR